MERIGSMGRVGVFYIMDASVDVRSSNGMDPLQMLLTSIVSVCMYSDVPLDIRILAKGVPRRFRDILKSVPVFFPGKDVSVSVVDTYEYIGRSRFRDDVARVSESRSRNDGRFARMALCKPCCAELFPEYDEVLCFDNDVFSNGGSVDRLSNVGSNVLVGTLDPYVHKKDGIRRLSRNGIDFEVCTGLLLFNTRMLRDNDWALLKSYWNIVRRDVYPDKVDPKTEIQAAWHDQSEINMLLIDEGLDFDIFDPLLALTVTFNNGDSNRPNYSGFMGRQLTKDEEEEIDNPGRTLFIHTTSYKVAYRNSDAFAFPFARKVNPAVVLADRIRAVGELRCETSFREYRNIPSVERIAEPYHGSNGSARNVVMSFTGRGHFVEMALPTAMSAMEHTGSALSFHFLTDSDGCSGRNEDSFYAVCEKLGRHDSCRFYDVPSKVDLECFDLNNRWAGIGCYLPQLCSSVLDIDDFVLFMDTDVYVLRDVEDLFALCDTFTDRNMIVGRTRISRNLGIEMYDTSAFPLGGFFLFNPKSDMRRFLFRSMWSRCCHVNDDYSSVKCARDDEIFDISDYLWFPSYRDDVSKSGKVPYAVHFVTLGAKTKFDLTALPESMRHYATAFLLNRRIAMECSK